MKDFYEWKGLKEAAINPEKHIKPGQELVDRIMDIPLVYLVPAMADLAQYVRSGGDKAAPIYKGGEPESKSAREPGDGPGYGVAKALDPEEWKSGSKSDPIEKRYNWKAWLDAFARVANQVTVDRFHEVFGDAEYSADPETPANEAEYDPIEGEKSVTLSSMGLSTPKAASGLREPAKTATEKLGEDDEDPKG